MEWNILPHTSLPAAAHQVESQFGGCAVKTTFGRHIVYTFLFLSYSPSSHYSSNRSFIFSPPTSVVSNCWLLFLLCVYGRITKAPGIPAVILFRIPSVFRWTTRIGTLNKKRHAAVRIIHRMYSITSSTPSSRCPPSTAHIFYQIYAEPQCGKNKVLMEVITSCCLFLSTHPPYQECKLFLSTFLLVKSREEAERYHRKENYPTMQYHRTLGSIPSLPPTLESDDTDESKVNSLLSPSFYLSYYLSLYFHPPNSLVLSINSPPVAGEDAKSNANNVLRGWAIVSWTCSFALYPSLPLHRERPKQINIFT